MRLALASILTVAAGSLHASSDGWSSRIRSHEAHPSAPLGGSLFCEAYGYGFDYRTSSLYPSISIVHLEILKDGRTQTIGDLTRQRDGLWRGYSTTGSFLEVDLGDDATTMRIRHNNWIIQGTCQLAPNKLG